MCYKNPDPVKVIFKPEDFYKGARFDYIAYVDRPEFRLHYKEVNKLGLLMQGSRVIGEVSNYGLGAIQVNIWVFNRFTTCYLKFADMSHHKPVGHFIKSLKNRIHITKPKSNV